MSTFWIDRDSNYNPMAPTVADLKNATRISCANITGYTLDYSPADELRDRLNDRLQGKEPTLPVNTQYWRGL